MNPLRSLAPLILFHFCLQTASAQVDEPLPIVHSTFDEGALIDFSASSPLFNERGIIVLPTLDRSVWFINLGKYQLRVSMKDSQIESYELYSKHEGLLTGRSRANWLGEIHRSLVFFPATTRLVSAMHLDDKDLSNDVQVLQKVQQLIDAAIEPQAKASNAPASTPPQYQAQLQDLSHRLSNAEDHSVDELRSLLSTLISGIQASYTSGAGTSFLVDITQSAHPERRTHAFVSSTAVSSFLGLGLATGFLLLLPASIHTPDRQTLLQAALATAALGLAPLGVQRLERHPWFANRPWIRRAAYTAAALAPATPMMCLKALQTFGGF